MDVSHTEHSHVIGKGGNNIKQVMQDTGCHIHFPDSNRNNQLEKSNQVGGSLAPSLPCSPTPWLPHSLAPSLPHSLAPSLPSTLAPRLPHSLAPSLPSTLAP